MGSGEACLGQLVFAFILSPVILQGYGMFSSDWLPGKSCSTIEPKLDCCIVQMNNNSYSNSTPCSSPFGLADIDFTAYSLHSGAFTIMLLPFVCACFEIWYTSKEEKKIESEDNNKPGCCLALGGLCFLLYPIAGMMSFIGCMIVVGKFSGSSFGQSFKLSLSAGLIVLAITGILIVFICFTRKNKASNETNAPDDGGSGVTMILIRVNVFHIIAHRK